MSDIPDDPVPLVSADYRRYLEQLECLLERGATEARHATPFRIGGTMQVAEMKADGPIDDARREQRELLDRKFADL